ncbi:class A beta-lactamase [Parasphingorhabdus sp.]|uniref:class A beta-lactamase n=1 Tax=Parasphingorhabdus sp. TaxID=2709688 RepID=UPI0030027819
MIWARRDVLLSAGLVLLSGCAGKARPGTAGSSPSPAVAEIEEIEGRLGGRLGVCLLDNKGSVIAAHRGDERFAMCSTFKAALACLLFAEHEAGRVDMFAKFLLKPEDRVPYMPFVEANLASQEPVSLYQLAGATVMTSDNAAANLIIRATGGPAAFTRFVRSHGDTVTQLNRLEPELNENIPGDPRDTTSPKAMARLMLTLAASGVMAEEHRLTLQQWMIDSTTGRSRIRAGLPDNWLAGDKTGTATAGIARNDIALIWPSADHESANPFVLTVYMDRPTVQGVEADAAMAEVARVAARLIAALS